jgi:hypothetical protein
MPFPMVHLIIADRILASTKKVTKPSEFLLGSIAPDSVHFKEIYMSEMKKASHLCVGDQKWGQVTNNSEWAENVMNFLKSYEHEGNIDFIYGYCVHILTDIRNNIVVWTPYRLKNQDDWGKGLNNLYHIEASEVDFELYKTYPAKDEVWKLLEQAEGKDIPGVVDIRDITGMKSNLLYRQFRNREPKDSSAFQYVTAKEMMRFIDSESEYVKKMLGWA